VKGVTFRIVGARETVLKLACYVWRKQTGKKRGEIEGGSRGKGESPLVKKITRAQEKPIIAGSRFALAEDRGKGKQNA